jgi:hypothetical protein
LIVKASTPRLNTHAARQWKIALRTNAIEWSGIVPTMPLPFADVPDLHADGAPSRSGQDPSYRRPLVTTRAWNVPGG